MVVDFLKERVQTGKLEALKQTENHQKATDESPALIEEEVKVEAQEEEDS